MAPLSVAKMDNGVLLPFQNSKRRLYEEDEQIVDFSFKKPMPVVPVRAGVSLNDGYKKAIKILNEIKKNEHEIEELLKQ